MLMERSSSLLFRCILAVLYFWLALAPLRVSGNPDAKRLYEDVMLKRDYNSLIRPVSNYTDTLTVYLSLKLAQLIDIDEKNQIMTTNVWVKEVWREPRLSWNPSDYGGIKQFRLPSASLWLPDVVLFNNADGNYEVSKDTKAMLFSTGMVIWEPPAIFRSSCQIDVEFFPFDKQLCSMKLGSWTYDGLQVDLRHVSQTNASSPVVEYGINLDGHHESTEWDILHVPATRNQKVYPCCPEPYPDITFTIVLRRKTLFYTINLIFPCVAISFLTMFVFYLPGDSGEKTTLCISILIAVTFFFLVLAESIPPTSLVVPLLGKYLLFTMTLVTLSIVVTVLEMNYNERTTATHRMSPWTRKIFLEKLPKLLMIERPKMSRLDMMKSGSVKAKTPKDGKAAATVEDPNECNSWRLLRTPARGEDDQSRREATLRRRAARSLEVLLREEAYGQEQRQQQHQQQHQRQNQEQCWMTREMPEPDDTWQLRPEFLASGGGGGGFGDGGIRNADPAGDPEVQRDIRDALSSVQFIAKHMQAEVVEKEAIDDWKFITRVLDRLFLLLFSIVGILGTFGMFLQAPSLYDSQMPIDAANMTFKTLQSLPLH